MAKHLTQVYDGHNNLIGEHVTDEDPPLTSYGILSVRTRGNNVTHYKEWSRVHYTLLEEEEDND